MVGMNLREMRRVVFANFYSFPRLSRKSRIALDSMVWRRNLTALSMGCDVFGKRSMTCVFMETNLILPKSVEEKEGRVKLKRPILECWKTFLHETANDDCIDILFRITKARTFVRL